MKEIIKSPINNSDLTIGSKIFPETPVRRQLREANEKIERERQEAKKNANPFKLWLLKSYLSIKGYFKTWGFKKNQTYKGGRNGRYSIYMGNCTFFERIQLSDVQGFCYYNNKPIKYKYWEIGIFDWKKDNSVKIITDKDKVSEIW